MKLEHTLTPCTKINPKWLKDKYKTWHHKTSRRDYRQNILWHQPYLCFPGSASQGNRNTNKKKMVPNQTQKLLYSKGNQKQTKRQSTEWEKMFANDATNTGSISIIYKQFIQLNSKTINSLTEKWEEDLKRHFSKEDIQMANRHMERCSHHVA